MTNQTSWSFLFEFLLTKYLAKLSVIGSLVVVNVNTLSAAEITQRHSLSLPSCNVTITADQATNSSQGKIFEGNVKVLIGFANLRAHKVILIKQDNGRCLLLSESVK
ncbi:hypothetical protein ACUR5C_09170 [Aliikangiella sp. IMCC44653]